MIAKCESGYFYWGGIVCPCDGIYQLLSSGKTCGKSISGGSSALYGAEPHEKEEEKEQEPKPAVSDGMGKSDAEQTENDPCRTFTGA